MQMRKINELGEIRKEGLALTYIGTDWCQYCAKTTKAIGAVLPTLEKIEVSKIDGDDEPDILQAVGAKTYPQLLLHRDGVLVAQRESADADTLKAWLVENGAA